MNLANPGPNARYCPMCFHQHVTREIVPMSDKASEYRAGARCHRCNKVTAIASWLLWWEVVEIWKRIKSTINEA